MQQAFGSFAGEQFNVTIVECIILTTFCFIEMSLPLAF